MAILEIVSISFITSLITVWLALKRYKSEKWWDEKLEAYLQVIDAMSNIISFCDNCISEEMSGNELNEEERDLLEKDFCDAKKLLEKKANVGELMFAKTAYRVLIKFDGMVYEMDSYQDIKELAKIREDADVCLSSFIDTAKNDLEIQGMFNRIRCWYRRKYDLS